MPKKILPVCNAVIRDKKGRFLLVQETKKIAAGLWNLPGGRLEPDETLLACLHREILEETGLRIRPKGFIHVYDRPKDQEGAHCIQFLFLCGIVGGTIKTSTQHPDIRFFSYQEIMEFEKKGKLRGATGQFVRDFKKLSAALPIKKVMKVLSW